MLDRLRDLNKYAESNPNLDGSEHSQDEEMGGDPNEFMGDFFSEVNNVRISLRKIENNNEALKEKYTEQLQKINAADKKKITIETDKIVDESNKIANEVKLKLELMVKTDTTASVSQMQAQSAEERIKKNTHANLVQEFLHVMETYQDIQAKYKSQHQENVKRQVLLVNPEATLEEIADVIQSGEAEQIFAGFTVKREQAAKTALSYIRDRHQEIMKIEKSLNELQQLFVDMAVLVAEQSEMISSIETNIETAVDYVREGVGQLKKANKLQKKSRKCMIAIIVIVGGVLVGLSIFFAVYYSPKDGANNSTTPVASGQSGSILGDFSVLNNPLQWGSYNKK